MILKEFRDLRGCVLSKVENNNNEELVFTLKDGSRCVLYHKQECCEGVYIEDINGDLDDLVGSRILLAKELCSENTNPEDVTFNYQDSFTWTFYNLATVKGYVTIRWYGESNGYYSENVDFKMCESQNTMPSHTKIQSTKE